MEPPRLVLDRDQKLDLTGRNRWLGNLGSGHRDRAGRIVAAARDDQSFAGLGRRRVNYKSSRPRVIRVGREGVVTALRRGVATITVTVGGTKGRTSFVVR
ncbi:MAG: Ig-like domain-containing protein [Solirubrobacterales bacterium]|nr:Ig-like domain-containing protein [Solirubrobacterales bacterium]